jgi:hypothetical protein
MLHVSVLLTRFHQAYKHIVLLSGGTFSCTRRKLKYFRKTDYIRKAVPLVKIFNVVVGEHGNLGISLV